MSGAADRAREVLGFSRWWQVVAAAVMMGLVSPYQYVWSSIEGPLAEHLGVSLPALGLVFTLFVVFQAGSQFPVGWWRDRHGPRRLTLLAGVLAGGGYLGLAYATELWQLYLLYSLGAVGVGIVYTVAVNTAIKWFPDRRGLTAGVGTMAFAAGSALFVPYVRANATPGGYADVLTNMGLLIGAGILVGALVLRDPPAGWLDGRTGRTGGPSEEDRGARTNGGTAEGSHPSEGDAPGAPDPAGGSAPAPVREPSPSRRQYTSREVVRTWQFWVMYAMFVATAGAGLMVISKVVTFAEDLGVAAITATAAATVLPVASGTGRVVLGEVSDRYGRERTLAATLAVGGLGLFGVVRFALQGANVPFVAAVVVALFFWSAHLALFPSLVGDYYGGRYSSGNYAVLYSGKIWGGVFGGVLSAWLVTQLGWPATFRLGGALVLLAGVAALFLRAPDDRR